MALTKVLSADKLEVLENGNVQVRTKTAIKEDGVEISSSFHRHVLSPRVKDASDNWADPDISGEPANVQAICNAAWTDAVKTSFENQAQL